MAYDPGMCWTLESHTPMERLKEIAALIRTTPECDRWLISNALLAWQQENVPDELLEEAAHIYPGQISNFYAYFLHRLDKSYAAGKEVGAIEMHAKILAMLEQAIGHVYVVNASTAEQVAEILRVVAQSISALEKK